MISLVPQTVSIISIEDTESLSLTTKISVWRKFEGVFLCIIII